jgi:predicted ATPase/DNA-binding winged helix-turn-helix (wHTH) protein
MDPAQAPAAIEFGRFSILSHRRELLTEGQPLDLGGRAFDILMMLIEASGAVVSKDALMHRAWPDRIVEENSLQAQISALRRAFGAERDLIRTIAGRGYQFTGEIRSVSTHPDVQPVATAAVPISTSARTLTNLPEPVSELIGRDVELDEILDLSASHRLVTLTGAGGIGKTRLGFEAARHLLPRFADGVWAIELAPLSDPELVPVAVATALGLELASGTASPVSVATALRSKQLMLVLDNSEHVVDAAARMAEALLRANPAARVIATSREPLRAEGEWVYPVPPLAVPTAGGPDGEDPLRYGAVLLFVERARAAAPHFSPDASEAAAIAGICRRLDGIPLAIELAAARAAALGIEGIAARLDNRFRLLAGGHRTAMPRHQTLRATLDWSYELLTEPERMVLRRLAIFAGGFTLQAASAVTADDEIAASEVVDGVANLVAKSLVTADAGAAMVRYRLLETIRAYALEKLAESGEAEPAARRHATFFRDLFSPAASDSALQPAIEDIAHYRREIDNARAALDWSFSPVGDSAIGVVLTAAYAPVWLHSSLVVECRERAERALDSLGPDLNLSAPLRLRLHIALGIALLLTMGSIERTRAVVAKALEIAESLDDVDAQLRSLFAQWSVHFTIGECRAAQSTAERFSRVASRTGDQAIVLVADRLRGNTLQYGGKQREARCCLERVLELYVAPKNQRHTILFQYDQRALARAMLARVLWLQGFVDQANHQAQASLEEAQATDYGLTLCWVLHYAVCPVALMTGDLVAAERAVAMLIDLAASLNAAFWKIVGRCLEGKLLIERREFGRGTFLLRSALDTCDQTEWRICYPEFMGVLAEGLAGRGQLSEALATIDEARARAERGGERWYIAELLRIKGELLLQLAGDQPIPAAEACFLGAIDVAQEQGALFWELRAAISLARLRMRQDRPDDARRFLAPVYDRFTEGFDTADLRAAKALLDDLHNSKNVGAA